MPKSTKRTNTAADALGVGANRDKWTLAALVTRLGEQHTQLVKQADAETESGRGNRARLFWAQAAVIAEFLSEYYQDNSREPEDHTRWSHRFTRAQSFAFRAKNQIVENLHAGLDEASTTD